MLKKNIYIAVIIMMKNPDIFMHFQVINASLYFVLLHFLLDN